MDKADILLDSHYGLSAHELDTVLHYDLKFRTAQDD